MTALTRILSTTAFKLAAIYLTSFTALSVFLFIFISNNTDDLMNKQVVQTVDAEIQGLAEQYAQNGINGLVVGVERRVRSPNSNLYLILDYAGNFITGNIAYLPEKVLSESDGRIQVVTYTPLGLPETDENKARAIVRIFELPGNFKLLVGRDLEDQVHLKSLLGDALTLWLVGMIVLAGITWFFLNRRILKRIDNLSMSSRQIMEGDLAGRLDVTGNGDEFDRLASNLNVMLDRIEELMQGLKEVSDNIAHDLKTPLTRMRGRVEAALRQDMSADDGRKCLEDTLVETDELINTFNALLRIARVEAGSTGAQLKPLKLSDIVRDVCELYEPVAEDDGVEFSVQIEDEPVIDGDRELLAQALANLIENALKYGRPPQDTAKPLIKVVLSATKEQAILRVEDNGAGIAEADRERVCNRFVRLDGSRHAPGSGLGLSLIKAVVTLHQGELQLISAGSENDSGSKGQSGLCARVVLPRNKGQRGEGEGNEAWDKAQKKNATS
ncbi:two-component sensor histidine kinase [Pseudovibrio japonicus]|uniref:histidine kinase n=1 Tax=Pseudovibrio japonicus TaxID=366534 RepID=A0ABQ3E089_9HYPH|nr:HAMP domain-containing sensor histidine kinase [Pseudovibrio japonicus]GHB19362.1 two-component sensor histidine kinase [Pseudovibrio japonicus]